MSHFSKLGLSKPLVASLAKSGYEKPTPIQQKVIPLMLEGRDIVGIAQTGTGKTAAFVLPILQRLAADPQKTRANHCRALIIVPTRELAAQIDDNIDKYGAQIRHRRACIVGGVKYPKQINRLNQGLDILVATPGRLEDHLKSGNLSLKNTETLILDEADQMLDLGFFPVIRRIAKQAPRARQTVLLSATMPDAIRALANDLLDAPIDVAVTPQSTPVEKIAQAVMRMDKPEKRPFLVKALENQFRTIIFTRTKHGADQLVKYLSKQGVRASAIHGNKSQNQRQRALDAFRKGEEHILIATDIAARGIDIPDVSLVVNYDVPTMPEAYVHRIGRTARAGREGRAITLCAPEEKKYLTAVEKLIKIKLPEENIQVGQVDDAAYDPLRAPAKPAPNATPKKSRTRKKNDASRAEYSGAEADARSDKPRAPRKQRKPGKAKPSNRGSAKPEAIHRKKGGNKNPPRGPARRKGPRTEPNRSNNKA